MGPPRGGRACLEGSMEAPLQPPPLSCGGRGGPTMGAALTMAWRSLGRLPEANARRTRQSVSETRG